MLSEFMRVLLAKVYAILGGIANVFESFDGFWHHGGLSEKLTSY
jgi:hypothetical protein